MVLRRGVLECVHVWYRVVAYLNGYMYGMALGVLEWVHVWYGVVACLDVYVCGMALRRT